MAVPVEQKAAASNVIVRTACIVDIMALEDASHVFQAPLNISLATSRGHYMYLSQTVLPSYFNVVVFLKIPYRRRT